MLLASVSSRLRAAGRATSEKGLYASYLPLNRNVRGKAHGQFEYLRIVQTKIDTYYWASPGGSEPTPFKMTKATDDHVVFENPEHDFPKRIEYRLDGDELTAQIFGDEPGPSWTLKRIGDVQ